MHVLPRPLPLVWSPTVKSVVVFVMTSKMTSVDEFDQVSILSSSSSVSYYGQSCSSVALVRSYAGLQNILSAGLVG